MTPPSPTGRQCELRVGDAHAVITEVGATLRSFVVRGEDVIDGFSVDQPSPAGRGQVTVGTTSVDQAHLTIPAGLSLTEDERALPTGREGVAGTDLDFMTARAIGPLHMDTAFTDLRRDPRGRATVRLERPDGSRSVELWMEEEFRYAMVYTGDSLEPVGRRRRGLAVEPMTCPPNAFRSGVDLIALEPGTSWSGDWGIRV